MRNSTLAGPDGAANLLSAAVVQADPAARGMGAVVAFSDEVHAARWVRKQHSTSLATFGSPNQGPIGHVIENRFTVLNAPPRLAPLACPGPDAAAAWVALYTASFDDDGLLLDGVEESHDGLVVAALGGGHVAASMAHRLAAIAERIPVVLASRTGAGPVLRETCGAVGSEFDLQRPEHPIMRTPATRQSPAACRCTDPERRGELGAWGSLADDRRVVGCRRGQVTSPTPRDGSLAGRRRRYSRGLRSVIVLRSPTG